MKPFTDAQFAFKAACRRAVKMAGGPHAASEFVRVDAARLSRYGNPDCPEFAPVDVCFALDKAAGQPVIFNAWADLVTHQDEAHDVTHLAGSIAKESGDLISTAIEAASDGTITPNEARQIDEAAADLQDKVVNIRNTVRKSLR